MKNPDHDSTKGCQHVQWAPLLGENGLPLFDEKGQVKHWVCSCGVIVPDPVDPHPEESFELLMEEFVRASRELLATPIHPNENATMTELRRSLQASIDDWDRSTK